MADLEARNALLEGQLSLYRDAVEHMHQAFCVFDDDGRIALCSNGFADVLHLPLDRVHTGVTIRELTELSVEAGYHPPGSNVAELEEKLWADLTDSDTRSTIVRGGRTYAVQLARTPSGNWVAAFADITAQLETETALRESEAGLQAILDAMPDCVKIFSDSGELVHINPAGLALLQAPDLESLRAPSFESVAPEYLEAKAEVHSRVMAGESVIGTYEIVGLQGRRRHVEAHAVPFRMPDGSMAHLCISRDVSEREEANHALRRSEERLRLVHEATGLADFEVVPDRIDHISEAFREQAGLGPDVTELSMSEWLTIVHPDDRPMLREAIGRGVAKSDNFDGEYRIVRQDTGEVRWISSHAKLERDEAGLPIRTIGAHIDITKRKLAEVELRESEERLRLVQEATGLANFEAGPDGITWFSEQFVEQIGLPPGTRSMMPEEWLKIIHPDDRERFEQHIVTCTATADTVEGEFRIVRPDTGEVRWIGGRTRRAGDETADSAKVIGVHIDITKRKLAEVELRGSEERLRLVQEATGLADFEADGNGLLACSDRFLEQLGLPPGDSSVQAKNWTRLVHPEDRDGLTREIEQSLEKQEEWFHAEFRIIRADNKETRWIACSTKMERDEQGRLIRTIGAHLDITERKKAADAVRRSEERLRLVEEATGLAHFEAGPNLISRVSERFIEQTGLPPDTRSITPTEWNEIIHPDDRERFLREVARSIEEHSTLECEFRIIRPDTGETRWLYSHCKIERDENDGSYKSIGAHLDITERKLAEEVLRESEERFRLAAEAAGLGVWDYDVAQNRRDWSDRLRQIFGVPDDVEPGLEAAEACIHPADRTRFMRMIHDARDADLPRFEGSFRIHRGNDGAQRWIAVNGWRTFKTGSRERRSIMTVRDVTEEKTAEKRIRWTASHDSLTRLANRNLFHEKLELAIQTATAKGGAAALLLLDLDHFKQINDTLGHDAGDRLLQMFAERLGGVVRASDTVARLGGDEFAVVLPEIDGATDVVRLSSSIEERLREPFVYDGQLLDCRVSMGASVFPVHGRRPEDLLKNADVALYAAKASGCASLAMFEPAMRDGVQRRAAMIQLARNALRDDRIVPYYQPKLDLCGHSLVGFEALLRWRTPTGRIGAPAKIEAAFEDLDAAAQLSDRMIERVIADMRGWLDRGIDFKSVAVNASAAEFRSDNFAERVVEQLRRAEIPTSCFQVEVTETVFLGRGAEYVHRALALLDAHGIRIALDDFGTGYASLRHLKQFPVDIIKIDQSFVRNMADDPGDEAIIRAVINLGRSLGIKVVAEGIESEDQERRLLELDCDFGQGFLYSRAVSASRVPALVDRWPARHHTARRDLRLVANRV